MTQTINWTKPKQYYKKLVTINQEVHREVKENEKIKADTTMKLKLESIEKHKTQATKKQSEFLFKESLCEDDQILKIC